MTPVPNSPLNTIHRKRERSPSSLSAKSAKISKSPVYQKSPKTRRIGSPLSLETKIKTRNITKVLSKVCPNADECLALSAEYMPHINKVFDSFSNFKMLSGENPQQFLNIASGSNGFTNVLYFSDKDSNYHSMAIMKSAHKYDHNMPDNLIYEGLTGLYYINEKCYQFPCFVETYGIYRYKPHPDRLIPPLKNYLMNNNSKKYMKIPNADFEAGLVDLFTNKKTNRGIGKPASKKTIYNSEAMQHAFENPTDLCILIQSIKHAKTLGDYLSEILLSIYSLQERDVEFTLNQGLLCMLFQIYSVLSYISDEYTHNDLHPGNVLIYSLEEKYIRMVYHIKDKQGNSTEVIFYTNKILKMIDYGRSYVNGEHFKSTCFYQSVCQHEQKNDSAPEEYSCDETNVKKFQTGSAVCGKKIGFNNMWKQPEDPATTQYISSVQRNKTADMLLLQRLAMLFMRYVYKYEHTYQLSAGVSSSATGPKRLVDYMDSPSFYLVMNAFSMYRNIVIENDKADLVKMIHEISDYLHDINHPMSKHLTGNIKTDFKFLFDSVSSSFIIANIQKNNPELFKKIEHYEKVLKPSLFDSKDDFEKYHNMLIAKNKLTDSAQKADMEKKIKIFTMWINRFHLERTVYIINEMIDNSSTLSNVDKVSNYLIQHLQTKTGPSQNRQTIEDFTQDYYETNTMFPGKPQTYFGELHIYLDGSQRNSHFVAATNE